MSSRCISDNSSTCCHGVGRVGLVGPGAIAYVVDGGCVGSAGWGWLYACSGRWRGAGFEEEAGREDGETLFPGFSGKLCLGESWDTCGLRLLAWGEVFISFHGQHHTRVARSLN